MNASVTGAGFRHALSQFASGVTVITTGIAGSDTAAGCTVSAFSSLSLDPPLVLVCIARGKHMHRQLTEGQHFAVNILADSQRDVAMTFARATENRFASTLVTPGRHNLPLIHGAVVHLQCSRHATFDGGDHEIVIGRVEAIDVHGGRPLVYADGSFLDVSQDSGQDAEMPYEWLLSAPW